jgi:hypothetical protein
MFSLLAEEGRFVQQSRARLLGSSKTLAVLFTLIYLLPTLWLSKYKLFWDDEFFTLYLARIPAWKELLRALSTGADQHPPVFYRLTYLSMQIFGHSAVSVRLPAVAGFWLLCVCVFFILRPLTGTRWAVVGMLFPLTTKLYSYACEARGYGLVAGFSALALLSWFRCTEDRRRSVFLPLLAFSVAMAVSSHYYAVVVLLALGIGELLRTSRRRRVDGAVCLAILFGLVPLFAFVPVLRASRGYSAHFWAVPQWPDAFIFYKVEFGAGLTALTASVGFSIFLKLSSGEGSIRSIAPHGRRLSVWQAAAVITLSLTPLIVMLAALLVTHGFTDRYAIPAITGFTVLLVYLLQRTVAFRGAANLAILVCLVMYCYQIASLHDEFSFARRTLALSDRSLLGTGAAPVAVMDVTQFHQLSFYEPRAIAQHLSYLSDPQASIRYLRHDTIDRGLLALNPWFPLQVVPINTFIANNPNFFAFGSITGWSWLAFDLPEYGQPTLLKRTGYFLLFSVRNAHAIHEPSSFDQQFQKVSTLSKSLPGTGPSVCELYLGKSSCPDLRTIEPLNPASLGFR